MTPTLYRRRVLERGIEAGMRDFSRALHVYKVAVQTPAMRQVEREHIADALGRLKVWTDMAAHEFDIDLGAVADRLISLDADTEKSLSTSPRPHELRDVLARRGQQSLFQFGGCQ